MQGPRPDVSASAFTWATEWSPGILRLVLDREDFLGDPMDGVICYTFSTIAATFGSAVGIIIAAAIFRMQRIDQIATGLSQKVTHAHAIAEEQRERLARAALVQDWHSICRDLAGPLPRRGPIFRHR